MDHKNYIAEDRISELPDHLQQNILSYLSINEVVQSSVLSRRWKHVWTAVPVLGFNTILFGSTDDKKNLDIQRKLQDFYIFMGKSLESRHKQRLTIREFILTHGLDKRSLNSRVDCWINYVVKSDVKKLSLHFAAGYYDLPQSVLVAKSITVLILRQCKLDTNCGDINLPFLKKLSLSYVDADDKTIQKLVAGSPVIEDMKFLKCHGLKSIKFSGLIKAKSIEVELNDDLERVELEASNLCRVVISQTKQCEINLLSCNNLRMLTLSAPNITDKWLHNNFSQLPLIEYLSIYSRTLERLKISSHSLKTLYLMHWGSLIEDDIDTPNLRKFAYCGRNVIPFSSNALALSEVTYQMLKPPLDIAPRNVEKIEFLTKLGKSKQLTLTSTSAKDLVIPKKLRDSLPSPSYYVKQLKVETSNPRTGQEIVELVDSLLWISPLPEILIIRHRINMEPWMTFKFSYEKPILEGEKPSCCKFLPIPCWRHCLKSVMIENFRMSADEETQKTDEEILEKYFHKNTESLESFQYLAGGIASNVSGQKKLSKYLSLNKNLEMHSWPVTSGLSSKTLLNTS